MKKIILGKRRKLKNYKKFYTIVDDSDFEKLDKCSFCLTNKYATTYIPKTGKRVYLHRLIMNTPKGMDTDHINGDKLDNRRSNLRICTRSENNANRKKNVRKTSSIYKGVSWAKQRNAWECRIEYKAKQMFLGYFLEEKDAAKAYNKKAKELFGEFVKLNEYGK